MTKHAETKSVEYAAYSVLRIAADFPGQIGRLRAARIICGLPVPHKDGIDSGEFQRYAITDLGWPLREVVDLIDALMQGELIAQTTGARPALVLTRIGCRALDALESEAGA